MKFGDSRRNFGQGASGLPKERPARWAATGGAPQLAVHGAFRYEWADQMLEVVSTNLSNR